MTWELSLHHHFDAAHRLPEYDGPCGNLHGHRWDVAVKMKAPKLNEHGMVADFAVIKAIIDQLDHEFLNNWFENPTAELIAEWLSNTIREVTSHLGPMEVTVWESPGASITFR